jgi:hypothetical protein
MPILQAQIQTERASRYLVQFCKHAAAMGSGGHSPRMHLQGRMARREVQVAADWSDTGGTVTFTPWGRCTLGADAGTLTLRIDAADQDGLTQIRDIITRDLQRFSNRDPDSPAHPGRGPGHRGARRAGWNRRGGLTVDRHSQQPRRGSCRSQDRAHRLGPLPNPAPQGRQHP